MNRIDRYATAIGLCLALAPPALAQSTPPDHAPWRLVWFAIAPTSEGPVALKAPEFTPFANEADCAAFGQRMTPRMQDWVRGLVRAEWDHDVRVAFECQLPGVPA